MPMVFVQSMNFIMTYVAVGDEIVQLVAAALYMMNNMMKLEEPRIRGIPAVMRPPALSTCVVVAT